MQPLLRWYITSRYRRYITNRYKRYIYPAIIKEKRVKSMFIHLKDKQELVLHRRYRIKGQLCYLSGARLKNSDGVPELQILISFSRPDLALSRYKERWQIESCFRGMKSSGFNIEDTHLVHLERVEQLFGVMIISFTWAYLVGIKKDIEVKAIRILKTGNRAISVMKYGLEHITSVLLNPLSPNHSIFLKFCHVLKNYL